MSTAASASPARQAALCGFVLTSLVLAAAAWLWLSAALFLLVNKTSPARARLLSLPGYFERYGGDPLQRRRLVACTAGVGLLVFVLGPIALLAGVRRQRPLHGAARFASFRELQRTGLLDGQGIILGRWKDLYLMLPGQQYVMVAAPPRSGKGRGIAIPNLLNWDGSAVVLDVKGEALQYSSGWREAHGQQVFCWAPFDDRGHSHRYNPLGCVRNDELHRVSDLLAVGSVIYPTDGSKAVSTENFFNDQARNLFLALGLYLLETPELPRTIGQMLRLASGDLRLLVREREAGAALTGPCLAAFNRFLSNPENTLGSILSTFNAPLTPFADPVTDAATSASDFDLADLRRRRMTVYVVLPFDKLGPARLLISLFFTQVFNLNARARPEEDPSLRHQCLVLLDEFTVAGRIDIIGRAVGFMPGYDMRLLVICQSTAQIAAEYGRDTAQAIRTAMGAQVLFAPKEQADAEEYSRMLGTLTERVRSRGRSHSTGTRGGSSGTSENESPQRRPLLLPQELRELGPDEEIVILEGHKPILARKAFWHDDPAMAARIRPPVAIPPLDLALHRARIEQRVRALRPDEPVTGLEQLALAPGDLPALEAQATQAEVDAFVDSFLARVEPGHAAAAATAPPQGRELPGADGEIDLSVLDNTVQPERGRGRD